MNRPSISIILPTHNRARLVARALRSIQAQTDPEFEVVVIDDGSSDDTPQLLAGFAAADSRIRLLRNDKPQRVAAARNRAIREASGEWMVCLDDDDEFLPDYVARLRSHLHAHPEVGLAWAGIERVWHNSTPPRREPEVWHHHWDGKTPIVHEFLLMYSQSFGVATRRQAMLDAGLFDELISSIEDIDLAMRLVAAGTPYAAIPEVLVRNNLGEVVSLSRSRDNRTDLRLRLLNNNVAFLQSQPMLLAHYRLFAMSGCYRDGRMGEARALAGALLRSGRLGGRGLEMVLRYELFGPVKRLFRGKSGGAAPSN